MSYAACFVIDLQRDDLHELEEAEGYERLMQCRHEDGHAYRAAKAENTALREALGAARADALECAAAATSAGLPRSWAGDFEAIARRCDVPLGGLVLPGLERGGVQANDGFARLCTGCGVAEGEDHQPECRHLLAGRVANRTGWHCNACNSSGAGVFAIRDGAAVCPICLSEGKPGNSCLICGMGPYIVKCGNPLCPRTEGQREGG